MIIKIAKIKEMRHLETVEVKNKVWGKLSVMMAMVFFLYLGDAIISEWAPTYMQGALGGSLLMGLMMSFSSLIGFGADLLFPQLLKSISSRKMIMLAIASVFLTAGILLWTTNWIWVLLFLLAMGTWGLYYEFLGFGLAHFVNKSADRGSRAGVWSVLGIFKSVAYFIGPMLGGALFLANGNYAVIGIYVLLAMVALIIWKVIGYKQRETVGEEVVEIERPNLLDEIKCWMTLSNHVWPILVASLTLGLIDAAIWTTGVVLSVTLEKIVWWGALFVPMYMLPSIFVGFLVARRGITNGKKRLAFSFMLLTGILTAGLGLSGGPAVMLLLAFLIGISTSIAWPLIEAVYSDIASRMGREEKHIMGLSSSTINLSYITGPVLAGLIASKMGEATAMMWIGIFVAMVAVILLIVTPRKIRLPRSEIETWK